MDYKQLLEPIEGESPSGYYLKGDRAQYRALRNTFNAAQSSFRRLVETPESSNDEELFEENQKNWQAVSDACWEALTQKSKDVEIYCWWVMSLVFQQDSINKIATALETLTPFLETFWPDINPYLPDEKLKSSDESQQNSERAELQLKPLIQLLGESNGSGLLYMPLQMLSLVGEIDHTQYLSATKAGTLSDLKAKALKDFSAYQSEITETVLALDLAITSIDELDKWLKEKIATLSLSAISTQFLKTNLSDCLLAIKHLVEDSFQKWPLATETVSDVVESQQNQTPLSDSNVMEQVNTPAGNQPTAGNATSQVMNRDLAFHELRRISEYFAEKEPHSPVSFLLEKAIRWGYMSLPDLMEELVSGNDKVLGQINLVTGISEAKANLPSYTPAVVKQDNNSTQAQPSAITEEVNNSQSSENTASASGSDENENDTEFSW